LGKCRELLGQMSTVWLTYHMWYNLDLDYLLSDLLKAWSPAWGTIGRWGNLEEVGPNRGKLGHWGHALK
jgi:hypothetical protein